METTNQETQSALARSLDIVVKMADVEQDVEARLKKLAKTTKMAGFRPGKVPMKIVAQTYGGQARSEAMSAAIEKTLADAIREQNLRIAGYPRIEPKAGEGDAESMTFTAHFEVYPEIQVGDLSGQKIERPQIEIGEAEVDKTIDVLRKQRTLFEDAGRASQEGDRVVIDFVGKRDGEAFEGGTATDFPFVIGAGQMLADFDAAVRGLSVGEQKGFEMTFPEDYHAKNLAGQKVDFEVTVKKVQAPKLPEINEEFARALGVADGDIGRMRDEVRANLGREVRRRIQSRLKEQAMEALLATHPIEVPKALVESEARQLAEGARRDLEMRGMRSQDIPVEPRWFADQAVRRVKLGLIMAEIVKRNELHARPEQIRAMIEEFAQSYEDPAEVVRWYYNQPERMAQAEALAIEENVVDWVTRNAQTEDKTIDFDELMGEAA